MKVAAVILNWNNFEDTKECISSIKSLTIPAKTSLSIIVVDNASTDNSPNLVKTLSGVKAINNAANRGYSGGNNVGIKFALSEETDFVWILNPDVKIDKNCLISLINYHTANPHIHILSPKIYFYKGQEYHKERYTAKQLGKIIFYAGGTIDWDNILGKHIGLNEVDLGQYDQSKEINFATGCSIFLKSEVFRKIGFFDERYFLYLEDLDFSYRAAKTGIKIAYVPKAILWHKNARSSKVGGDLHDYYITRNRMLFGLSHGSIKTKAALVKESLRLVIRGRYWQKRGILDYYFNRLYQGSYVHQKSR